MLFLIFINNIPDVISSQLGIYVDDVTIYPCLSSKSNRPDKEKMATALKKGLQSVVNWGRQGL